MLKYMKASDIASPDQRQLSPNTEFAIEALGEFLGSGHEAAMVEGWPTDGKAGSRASALHTAAHRLGAKNRVRIVTRKGDVYLVRAEVADD